MRVCFVCSGNICRSPSAEVVFADLVQAAGLDIEVDSAGTGGWHAGEEMDRRSRETLVSAGYRPGAHAAKQFTVPDLAARDVVVALDQGHLRELRRMARDEDERAKIVLLRSFDPSAVAAGELDVDDPYYGGADGFNRVLREIERASRGLLAALQHGGNSDGSRDSRELPQQEDRPPK